MPMDDDDPIAIATWLAAWWADVTTALAFLTRLPLLPPPPEPDRPPDLARATRAMPLVGAAIGLGGGAVYWLSGALGLTPAIAGLLAVAATLLLTGALHEDGLADSFDAFGSQASREDILRILKDSRIGSYACLRDYNHESLSVRVGSIIPRPVSKSCSRNRIQFNPRSKCRINSPHDHRPSFRCNLN